MDAFGYFYAIAAAGMSYAGLSVLTMILRQMLGGQMTKFDSFVARTWLQLGFMVTFGSILPPLLALLEVPTPMVWRISSGVLAIMLGSFGLTFPRRRYATKETRLPIPVMMYVAAFDLIALVLAANAIIVADGHLPGVHAAAITATLVSAALWFLFVWVHWYDAAL